jgi:hypothetical protein
MLSIGLGASTIKVLNYCGLQKMQNHLLKNGSEGQLYVGSGKTLRISMIGIAGGVPVKRYSPS